MHELPITQRILEISLDHAHHAGADRIIAIYVVMGQFSSFVDDSIQMYWDIISEGTIAVGAALYFQRVPAEMRCLDCGHTRPMQTLDFVCPQCGSKRGEVLGGDALYVETIEVECEEKV